MTFGGSCVRVGVKCFGDEEGGVWEYLWVGRGFGDWRGFGLVKLVNRNCATIFGAIDI